MKPLRYLFYRNYRAEPRSIGYLAWLVPLFTTAVAIALNLLCLVAMVMWIIGKLPERPVIADIKRLFVLVLATLLVVLYLRWIASGRYLRFAEEFRAESGQQHRVRTVLLYIYALVTFCGPLVVGYVTSPY